MNLHNVRVINSIEELAQLLLGEERPTPPKEEAFSSFEAICRRSYTIIREGVDNPDIDAGDIMANCIEAMNTDVGQHGAMSALLCDGFRQYIAARHREDRELFKTQFIAALDKAVQQNSKLLEEQYDTRTEQSTQERSAEPPTTP